MLQQTRAETVVPYYLRFMARFPDVAALARAGEDEVLALWSGLGYYARARNLHRAAQVVCDACGGIFPRAFEVILTLPGVGRSTAGAICAFAFGESRAILDGNVRRLLARYAGVEGYPGQPSVQAVLWRQAEAVLPQDEIEAYTQALMDFGSLVCTRTRPRCAECPLRRDCFAFCNGRVAEFPAPKPRRALPQREIVMLLLLRQGEVFLEKRPAAGIWGGLWSFPEIAPGEDAAAYCLARFGVSGSASRTLSGRMHPFTHFRLHILPVALEIVEPPTAAASGIWLPPADAVDAALPAPVRALLREWGEP